MKRRRSKSLVWRFWEFWRDGRRGTVVAGCRTPRSPWDGRGGSRVPQPAAGSSLWARALSLKGGFSAAKRTNPPRGRGRTGPPRVNPSLGGAVPCPERAEGAGTDRKVLGHRLMGIPWDQDTAGLFAVRIG